MIDSGELLFSTVSHQDFQALFATLQESVLLFDRDWICVLQNSSASANHFQAIGKSIWQLLPDSVLLRSAIEQRQSMQFQSIDSVRGQIVDVRLTPFGDGMAAVHPSAATPETKRLANDALDATDEPVCILSPQAKFLYANAASLRAFGRSHDELIGKSMSDIVEPPALAAKVTEQIRQVAVGRCQMVDETFYENPNGDRANFEYKLWPIFAADGSVDSVCCKSRDITRRKQTEREKERLYLELKNQQALYEAIIDYAPSFICTLRGPTYIFELANQPYIDLIGPEREIIGRTVLEAVPEVVGQGYLELLDRVYTTGEAVHGNEMPLLLRRNGKEEVVYINFVYQAMRETDGRIVGIFVHGFDVTELVVARTQAQNRENRFRQVTEGVPQLVWVCNAEGKVEYGNRRRREYMGVEEGGEATPQWWAHVHPDDRDRAQAAWNRSMETGQTYEMETRLRRHDGQYRWFLGRAIPIHDSMGKVERWYGTNTDIDAQKRLLEEREHVFEIEKAARAAAEAASRAKDEFLAMLSHELRTPLATLLIWANVLRSDRLADAIRVAAVTTILEAAQEQARLVEQLIDASRSLYGKLQVDRTVIDFSKLVTQVVAALRPGAEKRGIDLQLEYQPANVLGDAALLGQVISNLISNAIKFTPAEGKIRVKFSVPANDASIARLEVSDNGEGISAEFLPHAFDRFAQADRSGRRKHGGLGLGLSLVKSIVDAHGGTVRAESAGLGQGTTLTVDLPVTNSLQTAGEDEPAGDAAPVFAEPLLAGVRLLFVAGDSTELSLLGSELKRMEADVRAAASFDHAYELLKDWKPSVIVVGFEPPGLPSLEFIRRLRKDEPEDAPGLPTIAVARRPDGAERLIALGSGFDRYVAQPITAAELAETILSMLIDR